MAAIRPDSHRVWPFWVRQDGNCWFIAFHPCPFEKTQVVDNSNPMNWFRSDPLKEIAEM
jgi:hypothetical protein